MRRAFVALILSLLCMLTPVPAFAQASHEQVLEHALLHQYSNQILDRIQSRKYCARVLNIQETSMDSGASGKSFETVIGVVSQDIQGRWEYLRMTVVDDVMGVRVTQ
ncbi:hypothetical protein [Alicyclobacillus mengziensis]|uniref:DUF3889 domain-containing protein n=1 Tax=Alicyclobacillus mengziensis TaxID=2931921 RepID=A0A9X7W0M9_9BACL|nr:hypothetical protein [Alicyclobacillus mengziensis]QSO48459.1 hypothetical protein JZ786_05575 [Alicyclobacillus mengziensis]